MRFGFFLVSTVVVCLALASPNTLQASCGQAFCPIETSTTTERYPHGGELQLNLVYEFIDLDDPYIGTSSARPSTSDTCERNSPPPMARRRSRPSARPATGWSTQAPVTRRLLPGGLRGRLALAISLITIAVVGGSFVALHQGTGADLRNRIDRTSATSSSRSRAAEPARGAHEPS